MDTSLSSVAGSKIEEYVTCSRDFSLPRSAAEHAFQLPNLSVKLNEIEFWNKTRLFVVLFGVGRFAQLRLQVLYAGQVFLKWPCLLVSLHGVSH